MSKVICVLIMIGMLVPIILWGNDSLDIAPTAYKGRFRPLKAAAAQTLYELEHQMHGEHPVDLLFKLQLGSLLEDETNLSRLLSLLQQRKIEAPKIAQLLEKQFPYMERVAGAHPFLKMLPSKYKPGEWLPLAALKASVYDPHTGRLIPGPNFTPYPDEDFYALRQIYSELERDYTNKENREQLGQLLLKNYKALEGVAYLKTAKDTLTYPALAQLRAEMWYAQFPFAQMIILTYLASLFFLFAAGGFKTMWLSYLGVTSFILAFLMNTAMLGMRTFILQRPPVSNMFETVIYVPWASALLALIFAACFKDHLILICAAFVSVVLMSILELTHLDNSLENVQAVLNSQYWLIIHVLMIVASYGVLTLSGVLGHAYLINKRSSLGKLMVQTMYVGVALLIPGTLLGGVWAAESWGRFWDWDPKESWAFISSCVYLIFIHAYSFQKIDYFGLAVGSIVGLMAISFTWYGVNYILGTGLHSYGFGSGGEMYYYLFLLAEILFVGAALLMRRQSRSDDTSRRGNPIIFPKSSQPPDGPRLSQ